MCNGVLLICVSAWVCQIPWNRSFIQLWATVFVMGIEPWSPRRATSTLNLWASFPAHSHLFFKKIVFIHSLIFVVVVVVGVFVCVCVYLQKVKLKVVTISSMWMLENKFQNVFLTTEPLVDPNLKLLVWSWTPQYFCLSLVCIGISGICYSMPGLKIKFY